MNFKNLLISPLKHPLSVLCVTFTLLVLMHTAATPVFEAPDEVWHYAYVRWLAAGHGLPAMDNNESGANQEVAQPPLYYWVAALVSAPFADADLEGLMWGNPHFGYQGPLTGADNKNMLIHTERERFPWHGAALAIHATRLSSWGFGLLTVVAAWGLGYETFGTRRGALVTAALVAFQPQFIFISSIVSNDSAAAALCTATLWSIAHGFRRGTDTRHALLTGVLAGLCALTKTSAMLMVGVAGSAIIVASLKSEVASQRWFRHVTLRVAGFSLAALLVGGWWYARNWVQYGAPLGMSSHTGTLWGRPEPVSLWALFPKEMGVLLKSFWAAYGWGHVMWANWVYVGLWGVSGGLLASSLAKLVRNTHSEWRIGNGASRFTHYVSRLTSRTLTMLWAGAWFGGIFLALLQWMRQVEAPHGRLLFPAIGAWAVLVAGGVESRKPVFRVLLKVLLVGMVGTAMLAPSLRIWRALGPPRLLSSQAALRTVTPVDFTYGERARLLGIDTDVTLDNAAVRIAPGDTFHIRACWEAVQAMTTDYTVFIHLIGPENGRVAERHTYPGLGRFPTSLWSVGRAFCDTYQITVEPWATGPIRYHLSLGLFDAETGKRLNAHNVAGDNINPPILGRVIVAPDIPNTPSPDINADVTVGELARLRGYDVPLQVAAGHAIPITLHWEALQTTHDERHLMTFIHIWQPGDAQALGQSDSVPGQGFAPTSIWRTGDRIVDKHVVTLHEKLAPGIYSLWAGMYDAQTGGRLSAVGEAGAYQHNLIPLGEITIVDK